MAKAIAFLVLLLISPAAYAVTYTVGGNSGWSTGVDYVTWATGQIFTTNDSLVFNFDSSHDVDEVSQANFVNCNTENPINSSSSSPTTIALTTVGTRFFICPRSNHCSRGQRLVVIVTAGRGTPLPPSDAAPPPRPRSRSPRVTDADPPPPPSGATSILIDKSSLTVGFSLVLTALIGIMG
ncbi:hypothetical protein BUALT_Bualt01G0194600 [Buddleja alternifolia]|uniref:Phytocyanin domain-containing protein n=1 Tax=Buddleja alternifolia TaxID=168488 RepID=A0AAV6YFD7_9LAMI|nr:hypothetical protein BUALT_Bualt01G0194600 [Buddleja alternifolia]